MAVRRTTWRPDTCACTVVYAWDEDAEPLLRTHWGVEHEETRRCELHQIEDAGEHFLAVLDHNRASKPG